MCTVSYRCPAENGAKGVWGSYEESSHTIVRDVQKLPQAVIRLALQNENCSRDYDCVFKKRKVLKRGTIYKMMMMALENRCLELRNSFEGLELDG